MKVINGKNVYSLKEVADMLGMSYQTAGKYVRRGLLPATRIGRQVAVTEESLFRWLNAETADRDRSKAKPSNTETE